MLTLINLFKILVFSFFTLKGLESHYLSNIPLNIFEANSVLHKWDSLEDEFKNYGQRLAHDFQLTFDAIKSSKVRPSQICLSSLFDLINGLKEYKLWAYSMLDATGKLPSGLLSFSTTELGSYEQCLGITVPKAGNVPGNVITGQYCLLEFILPLPPKTKTAVPPGPIFPFRNHTFTTEVFQHWKKYTSFLYSVAPILGICVPSTCNRADIRSIAKFFFQKKVIKPVVLRCESNQSEERVFDAIQIIVLAMFCLFLFFVILSTLYTCCRDERSKCSYFLLEIFKAFCAFKNSRNIFEIKSSENNNLAFLHGIKVFSIYWIILSHLVAHLNTNLIRDMSMSEVKSRSFWFQIISNGYLAVDSFFFASGLLLTNLTLKHVEENGVKFRPVLAIILRIARLLPSAMIVLGIYLLFPLLSRGPNWKEFFPIYSALIKSNWWTILIFINNLVPVHKMPMIHYWYIACDVQFFVVGIICLLIYLKKPRIGVGFAVLLIFISILTTAVLTLQYDVQPSVTYVIFDGLAFRDNLFLHFYPTTHLGAFAVGLLTGQLIAKTKEVTISRMKIAIGWIIAVVINLASLFGNYWWSNGAPITMAAKMFYGSIHRTTWAISLGWLSYMCTTGRGGFINGILSAKTLLPLSRLTYLTFLVHFLLTITFWSEPHGVMDWRYSIIGLIYLGQIVASFAFAFICYILFDGPIGNIQRSLFKRFI